MTGSTTGSGPGQQQVLSSVQSSDAFEELIWTNPEICSNCFARCKEIDEHNRPLGARGDVTYPSQSTARTPDGVRGEDVKEHDEHGAMRTHPPRTACENCGSVGLLAQDNSLSREEALGRVDAIADRLEEDGWTIDRDRARSFVSILKRSESLTNLDWEIFAAAVQHFAHPPALDT